MGYKLRGNEIRMIHSISLDNLTPYARSRDEPHCPVKLHRRPSSPATEMSPDFLGLRVRESLPVPATHEVSVIESAAPPSENIERNLGKMGDTDPGAKL
jgi:hypothetical protein